MNEGAEAGLKEGSFPRRELDVSVEALAARETRHQAPRPAPAAALEARRGDSLAGR